MAHDGKQSSKRKDSIKGAVMVDSVSLFLVCCSLFFVPFSFQVCLYVLLYKVFAFIKSLLAVYFISLDNLYG